MEQPFPLQLPPRRETPELEEMRSRVLQLCIWLVLGTTLAALCVMPFAVPRAGILTFALGFGPFFLAYGLSLWLLRNGRYRWAAGLFLAGTLVGQVGATLTASGVEAQTLISFVNLIAIAGFTVGGRAALAIGGVCAAMIAVHSLVDVAQFLPATRFEMSSAGQTVALITTILTNAGLVYIGLRHFGLALYKARQATTALHEAYDALAAVEQESLTRADLAERLVAIGELIVGARSDVELLTKVCRELGRLPVLSAVWVVDEDGVFVGGMQPGVDADPSGAAPPIWRIESDDSAGVEVGPHGLAAWSRLKFEVKDWFLWARVEAEGRIGAPESMFLETAGSLIAAGLSRLHAEQQLIRTQKMDLVNQFGAGIAHDLNNLLMAITTGTELVGLRVGQDDAEVVENLETVKTAAAAGAKLVGKLMSFARATTSVPEPIELDAILERMAPVLKRLVGRRIQLDIALPEEGVWVSCDPVAMEQIVLNLVVNARDAIAHDGLVRIGLANALGEAEVKLTVSDDGRGMTPAVQARIFEAFFTTRRSEGGTGLGLTTVYSLVRDFDGRIDVISEDGRGSRFEVSFPKADPPRQVDGSVESLRPNDEDRILLVDDDVRVRRTLRAVLERAGCTVDEAPDGQTALESLRTTGRPKPTVIVSDVVMPRLSGVDLLRMLRADGLAMPVVLMTGYAPEGEVPSAQDGVTLLAKPFGNDVLLRAISKALAGEERGRDTRSALEGED